jgi:hypothetical protein
VNVKKKKGNLRNYNGIILEGDEMICEGHGSKNEMYLRFKLWFNIWKCVLDSHIHMCVSNIELMFLLLT